MTYAELADEIRQWYREAENIATIDPEERTQISDRAIDGDRARVEVLAARSCLVE